MARKRIELIAQASQEIMEQQSCWHYMEQHLLEAIRYCHEGQEAERRQQAILRRLQIRQVEKAA